MKLVRAAGSLGMSPLLRVEVVVAGQPGERVGGRGPERQPGRTGRPRTGVTAVALEVAPGSVGGVLDGDHVVAVTAGEGLRPAPHHGDTVAQTRHTAPPPTADAAPDPT